MVLVIIIRNNVVVYFNCKKLKEDEEDGFMIKDVSQLRHCLEILFFP